MKHIKILLFAGLIASMATGCALSETEKFALTPTADLVRPTDQDEPLRSEFEEEWAFVGEEARDDLSRTGDPDRWWRNLLQSERAKNIERSLGFD